MFAVFVFENDFDGFRAAGGDFERIPCAVVDRAVFRLDQDAKFAFAGLYEGVDPGAGKIVGESDPVEIPCFDFLERDFDLGGESLRNRQNEQSEESLQRKKRSGIHCVRFSEFWRIKSRDSGLEIPFFDSMGEFVCERAVGREWR